MPVSALISTAISFNHSQGRAWVVNRIPCDLLIWLFIHVYPQLNYVSKMGPDEICNGKKPNLYCYVIPSDVVLEYARVACW